MKPLEVMVLFTFICTSQMIQARYAHKPQRNQASGNILAPEYDPLSGENMANPNHNEGGNSETSCRGLPCDEFAQMEAAVAFIKTMTSLKHGQSHGGQDSYRFDTQGSSLMGDIALTLQQAQDIALQMTGGSKKRSVSLEPRWSNPVHYVLTGTFSDGEKSIINEAIQFWQTNTCLDFQEGVPTNGNYLLIQNSNAGCWSYVGDLGSHFTSGQPLNLQPGCANNVATPIHELGHALGLWHEQSRGDRDDFVTIFWDNIIDGKEHNLEQRDTTFLEVPYDLASVMHYGLTYFTSNGDNTLEAKNPEQNPTIRSSFVGTFYDLMSISLAYQCASACPLNMCQNSGIPNSRATSACSECLCPEGFGGTHCETAGTRSAGCFPMDAEIVATTTEQCIHSPNWPNSDYNNDDVCSWIIQASSEDSRIEYSFKDDFFITSASSGTCYHYVEVQDSVTVARGTRYCGATRPDFTKVSQGNRLIAYFNAERGSGSASAGFQLCFKEVSTDTTTTPGPDTTAAPDTTPGPDTTAAPATTTSDPCVSNPCVNGGSCESIAGYYVCSCPAYFTGVNCETNQHCSRCKAANTKKCRQKKNSNYKCKCNKGWKGKFCTKIKASGISEELRTILERWMVDKEVGSGY